ncbi:MAG: hypothetical protein IT384_23065 [Deltaproteobacteria bacterium]|nr:hypothetical protein [Deltaproteobacteria bacterium]
MTYIGYPNNPYMSQLMSQLGLPGDVLQSQVAALPPFALPGLHAAYLQALGPAALLQGQQIPGFCAMPSPAQMQQIMAAISGSGYAGGGAAGSGQRMRMDLANYTNVGYGPGATLPSWLSPTRRAAAKWESVLRNDDTVRAQFEQAIGGRIVDFGGKNDGKITIERFGASAQPLPMVAANPTANTVYGMLNGMDNSIMSQAATLGLLTGAGTGLLALLGTGNPMLALTLGGLTGLATGLFSGAMPGMGMGMGGFYPGAGMGSIGGSLGSLPFGFNMLSGAGMGSWNPLAAPGHINNTNPAYEHAHQAQVASVLNDPSLSVEDKVMLMLALIMKKMDDDIERQMQYINALQNQQANRQGKGKALGGIGTIAGGLIGGPIGAGIGGSVGGKLGGGGQASPSVDVEMQKLQRMITKRAQLFEMASNIMKKYDDTARAAIQKMNS